MAANSIKANLTKDYIISSISLTLNGDLNKTDAFLVVEGPTDSEFFKYIVCNHVTIYESFSGKKGVYELVDIFNSPNVIGVCDADYKVKREDDFIFYYDNSFLETMLIADYENFDTTVSNLFTTKMLKQKDKEKIYTFLFNNLRCLSSFRKIFSGNDIPANFQFVNFVDFCDSNTLIFNSSKFFEDFICVNKEVISECDCFSLIAEAKKDFEQEKDFATIVAETQGHDCIKMLSGICNAKDKKGVFNEKSILALLMKSFPFNKTNLFESIKNHEEKYSIHFLPSSLL